MHRGDASSIFLIEKRCVILGWLVTGEIFVMPNRYCPGQDGNPIVDLGRSQPCGSEEVKEVVAAVKDQYTYKPWNDLQIAAGKMVREALESAAITIVQFVPPGPDRTVALRKLREARMDANSAITHEGKY